MTSLSLNRVLANLTVALLCGLFIANVYRLSFKGSSYSASYVQSLVAFALITTIIIMVIGNNLARAFGLVGSMSIIRFRMAIKDTKDIVFIFFTLAIGMSSGVGLYAISIAGTLFISIVILILSAMDFASQHKNEYLLNFYYNSEDTENAPYLSVLNKYCKRFRLTNVRSIEEIDMYEISYTITLKKPDSVRYLVRSLEEIDGVSNVSFFFDEV